MQSFGQRPKKKDGFLMKARQSDMFVRQTIILLQGILDITFPFCHEEIMLKWIQHNMHSS